MGKKFYDTRGRGKLFIGGQLLTDLINNPVEIIRPAFTQNTNNGSHNIRVAAHARGGVPSNGSFKNQRGSTAGGK